MKKYLGILSCLFLLSACDDGDMTFDSFDFSTAIAASCTNNADVLNSVFKLNNNEALLIKFPTNVFPFKNVEGISSLPISADNKIIYRVFNGPVTNAYFCSIIPPVSPTVVDEWSTADQSSGSIEIRTTPVDNTTKREEAKYDHIIVFKGITLSNATNGTVTYTEYPFGRYQTETNIRFAFSTAAIQKCANNKLFKIFDSNVGNDANRQNLNEVIILDLPPSLFQLGAGSEDYVVNDINQITYRLYGGDVTANALCTETGLPQLYEEWQAEDGLLNGVNSTGVIRIDTAVDGTNFVHTITLRSVKYKKIGTTNNTFVQDIQTFGDYITTN
ncbi:hypothetical protein [Flavobacterium microcysteis]|uniref:Uncharacterized protein n=1 Tax=Flavobacterium microcysteis TaxID=2596891 RepID=A0A501Q456_9FLAO|nr:hypothetical protein [Flavobacterium microcysteis]TPD67138.1 hypothetical protein FJA49_12725 [Flavobacterium microcysteis]